MNWIEKRVKFIDKPIVNLLSQINPTPIVDLPNQTPFFILGTGRNGSTLLSCILNNHPNIFIPGEAYILVRMLFTSSFIPIIGWEKFVKDNIKRLQEKSINWKIDFLKLQDILLQSPEDMKNIHHFWNTANNNYGNSFGKTNFIWGDKTPINTDYVKLVLKHFPSAKFIFLMRDPRGVVNSYLKTNYKKYISQVDFLLWKWKNRTELYQYLLKYSQQIHLIKYEQFLESPLIETNKILDFLNVEKQDQILNNYHQNMSLLGIEQERIHQNIHRQIDKNIAQNWQQELSSDLIKKINKYLKKPMKTYQYL